MIPRFTENKNKVEGKGQMKKKREGEMNEWMKRKRWNEGMMERLTVILDLKTTSWTSIIAPIPLPILLLFFPLLLHLRDGNSRGRGRDRDNSSYVPVHVHTVRVKKTLGENAASEQTEVYQPGMLRLLHVEPEVHAWA
jgi:hypothetical protein